jgi:hypothetical protein
LWSTNGDIRTLRIDCWVSRNGSLNDSAPTPLDAHLDLQLALELVSSTC